MERRIESEEYRSGLNKREEWRGVDGIGENRSGEGRIVKRRGLNKRGEVWRRKERRKTDSDTGPLQRLTNHGYPSLLYAVTNRKDDVSYRLDNQLKAQCDFLGRNPLWHTQCRAKYTNRKTVDQKRKKVEKPEGTSFEAELNPEPDNSRPNKKTRMSMPQPIKHKEECFICGRARTTRGNRSLILIATYDRQNAVWEKANKLGDEEILHKIRGPDGNRCTDMIAEDFRYHKECITNYLTKRLRSQEKTSTATTPYDAALNRLISR